MVVFGQVFWNLNTDTKYKNTREENTREKSKDENK